MAEIAHSKEGWPFWKTQILSEYELVYNREKAAKLKDQQQRKRKKNLGLLSFGEEAGDENAQLAEDPLAVKIKSVFDADIEDPRYKTAVC